MLDCRDEKKPTTLEVTAEVALDFPDNGSAPPSHIQHYLSGSTEEIASALYQYEQLGVGHLMFHCSPFYNVPQHSFLPPQIISAL